MTNEQYKQFALSLPTDPGVYRFLDAEGSILYVGKAKNLVNRLNSYFGDKAHMTAKTKVLTRHAERIEFTIVNTETDALLLENTLIKRHQPRYNVRLKDEKSPVIYVCIKKERFPRVFWVRKIVKDGSTYIGPYLSKYRIEQILELVRKLFQLRTCALALTESNIEKGKFKPCLEYHIKNCAAPCVGYESEETYDAKVAQIKNILKGNYAPVKAFLQEEMMLLAQNMEFERAQVAKEKLSLFDDFQGKSTVVNPNIQHVDVFAIAGDDQEAFIHYLMVVNGAIINAHTLTLTKNLDEDRETLLLYAVPYLRSRFESKAPEIIVQCEIVLPEEDQALVTVPRIGDKKKLLELAEKNVQYHYLQQRKSEASQTRKQTSAERILRTLKDDLQLDVMPFHIECFDNSNLMGTNPVSSCVVFKNGAPAKRDYRHYNVKTVVGPNDFATMEEVVYRRYKRLLAEGESLPQLIIIDGGKGQLTAAQKSVKLLGIENQVVMVGIAKRLEEIFFPDDPVPLYINKKSESLRLIQHARNEAHRFAITFHRDQRSRKLLQTELTEIAGIGGKTAEKLLTHFGSVTQVREASDEDLAKVGGKAVVEKLRTYFANSTLGIETDGDMEADGLNEPEIDLENDIESTDS
jgi:excinuclease ABC subunit C